MVLFQEESLSFIGANWSQEKGKQAKKHLELFAPGLFFISLPFLKKNVIFSSSNYFAYLITSSPRRASRIQVAEWLNGPPEANSSTSALAT